MARQAVALPPGAAYHPPPMDTPPVLLLQLFSAPRLLDGASGRALHVGSRKALLILAWLALEGSATRERLAPLLWPEVDTAGGRRNLRRELFRLRGAGVPLDTAADGTLTLHPAIQVDAQALLRERRLPDQPGPALEGLDGTGSAELDAWLQRWRLHLAQQRGRALAAQADAHEAAGDAAAALALQRERLAMDACHEDAALQVMRLQAALGDRSGALQTHQRLCEALRDELDLPPGEAVQALARALRQQAGGAPAPVLPTPPMAPAALPPAPPPAAAPLHTPAPTPASLPAVVPFIPRAAAQARIEAAWARGRRVYLHGVAGVGKTRLASELAAARGPWLRVACEPQDEAMPYASVVRLLRALRDAAPDVQLPAWVQRELAQLMPEFGPPPQPVATDEARQRLRAALAEAWRQLVQDNFAVLVLDDWHWGDAASVAVWSQLDEGTAAPDRDGVAWLIGYRSAQLPAAALQRLRLDVDTGRGELVALEGLAVDEVLDLTRALSGSPGGQLFSRRLQAATDGNAFFLLETLRHLMAQQLLVADADGWSTPFDDYTADYAELPVPPSVRAAVQARVHALGTPMLRMLELACLCRGALDARRLAGAAGQDEESVIGLLAHAQAAQLVQDTPAGWRFAHDLVRQSLHQGLSAARQRLLHERLARQIEAEVKGPVAAAPDAALATDLALHWEAAQQPAAAVRWRVAAAEATLRVHALDECIAHYSHALADGAQGTEAVAIHLAIARLQVRRADRSAADAALAEAAASAAWVASRDPEAGADLVLRTQLERADHLRRTDRHAEALALLDTLAAVLPAAPPPQQAQALTTRGALLIDQGRLHDGLALLQQGVVLIDTLPAARPQLAALLLEVARAHVRAGDVRAGDDWARRAVAAHEALDAAIGLGQSLVLLAVTLMYQGERASSLALLQRARTVARRAGDVASHRGAILNLVKLHVDAGETGPAHQLLDEGEALAPGFEHRRAEHGFLEARYYLHFLRGEWPQADAAADRLLAFGRAGSAPSDFIGICHVVVDLPLLRVDVARAAALLQEAQPLCERLAAQGADQYGPQQAIKRAWLALAEGRPADALARLPDPATVHRLEDRFGAAWIGAAAARARGDLADARRRLDLVRVDDEVAIDQYAPWLEQQLHVARAEGGAPPRLLARARVLLSEGRVPPPYASGLQEAVNAAATVAS